MRTRFFSRAGLTVAAASLAIGLAACGETADAPGGEPPDKDGPNIGLLLPENQTARYEMFDRPLIEESVEKLCEGCTVEYANAHNDSRDQHRQVNAMISKGVDALLLGAVDVQSLRSAVVEARESGIPVVGYDRLVEGPLSAYVSYDESKVRDAMTAPLLKAMGDKRDDGRIVRIEGPQFEPGAELGDEVRVKTLVASAWDAEKAEALMSGALASLGADNIDGVWAANDVLAAGAIAALKADHVTPLPPVNGQDVELPAVQRIISGEQTSSVYKPFKPEAETAARMAVALARGDSVDNIATTTVNSATTEDIPAVLLSPTALTVHNIEETVVKQGTFTIDEICTPKYQQDCKKAGLVE